MRRLCPGSQICSSSLPFSNLTRSNSSLTALAMLPSSAAFAARCVTLTSACSRFVASTGSSERCCPGSVCLCASSSGTSVTCSAVRCCSSLWLADCCHDSAVLLLLLRWSLCLLVPHMLLRHIPEEPCRFQRPRRFSL